MDSGQFGEEYTAWRLKKKGAEILYRNWQCRYGEVDIIALYKSFLLFVEVKTRKHDGLTDPLESITRGKQRRVIRTAAEKGLCGAILTVEGGAALGGSLSHVEDLLERGVRVLTLTWNGANELGSGILEEDDRGMTDFGRRAVHALTEGGCVMDVSHASEKLFWDLCETTSRPFIATHSDSKALCAAPRNLTDEQFAEIVRRGGLVGLNFCTAFLRNEAEKARTLDILRHADHFLSRGGEKVLAMGSDFDGCPLPPDMRGISSIPALYELFYKELKLSEETLDAIFYHNAFAFFTRH